MTKEVKVMLVIGFVVIALSVGLFFLPKGSSNNPSQNQSIADQSLLVRPDSYHTASQSAKVTLVEFGDLQCPACKAAQPLTAQLLKDYDSKIDLVFRNFPLMQHRYSRLAAEAAEAAGEQGKYWQMFDKLYETQEDWSASDKPADLFVSYAKDLGLDTNKFLQDINSNKFENKINRDFADGQSLGVNATPTFFFNGQKITGIPNYQDLKAKIDILLK